MGVLFDTIQQTFFLKTETSLPHPPYSSDYLTVSSHPQALAYRITAQFYEI